MIGDFPIYAKDMRITLNMAPGRDTAEKHRDWVQTCPPTQAWQVHPTPSSLDGETWHQEQPQKVSTHA